ncbi:MAG: NAD(P)-dependent oxidoreductase [Chloroflexi bacterium]|nr:NAD(P)-dependent oxidoreductase [Chloroflexota bacterium]
MKVLVTGGSGRAGEYIMAELAAQGHTLINADMAPPKPGAHDSGALFQRVDFTDYGQTVAVMKGVDAVVHMAAIPAPNMDAEHTVFRVNMLSNWNVLEAAELYGVEKIVMASSINAVGAGWGADLFVPEYFPVDEAHPTRVQDAYSQSKWLGEQMADAFCRRRKGLQIASMRFHGLWNPETADRHMKHGNKHDTSGRNAMGFWSWVGRHDAARACRLALEKEFGGHEAFFINAKDTVLEVPTEEAIRREYGDVSYRRQLPDFTSPLDISKAARLLDWEPVESWREGTVREPEDAAHSRPDYEAPWTR